MTAASEPPPPATRYVYKPARFSPIWQFELAPDAIEWEAGARRGRLPYAEPENVTELPDGGPITVAGIEITTVHAPGHTRGSVLFRVPDAEGELCFSGDVLFAGSIGRTDLPGGDPAEMTASLRDKVLPMPDETVVLPGHGPRTTIGRERRSNPYLRGLADDTHPTAPTRGW